MSKLAVIVGTAAVITAIGFAAAKTESRPAAASTGTQMPSLLQMMADARDLPVTPFVTP
jgi:hypothetical protein